jgi:hypothetical protein
MCKVVRVIGGTVLASEIEAIITKPSEQEDSQWGRIELRTKSGREFTYLNLNEKEAYTKVRSEAQVLREALGWQDVIERP